MTRYRDRYEEIYSLLSRTELQKGSQSIQDLSLGPELFGADTELWLGFYTREGLHIALEKYGFFHELEVLGFHNLRVEIRTDDPEEHLFRLWSVDPPVDEPLIELVVRRDFLHAQLGQAENISTPYIPVLNVDWLMLQNPLATFTERRPPLPGQNFPGLGVGPQVLEMLRNICHRLQLGGIVTVPSHFHNAIFYSTEFQHFDPYYQGAFLALCRDIVPQCKNSVAAASWALHWEMVRNRKGPAEPFPWFQHLLVNPMNEELTSYFEHPDFRQNVQQGLTEHDFVLYESPLKQALENRGIVPFDSEKIETWVPEE